MEIQTSIFSDENQIDVLRQVFTIVAQNGYKEEILQARYVCSVFFKDEALFDAFANYQINKSTSLLAYTICDAIKSKDTVRAMKLISRIAPRVTEEVEKMNPNKTYYKFIRYRSVFIDVITYENIDILDRMLTFPVSEKNKYALLFLSIQEKSIPVIKYFISKNYDLNYQLMYPLTNDLPDEKLLKTSLMVGVQTKNLEIVQLLVENGAVSSSSPIIIGYNKREYTSMSPILISCLYKNWDIFEYLLNNSNLVNQNEIIISLCEQDNIDQLKKVIEKIIKNDPIIIPNDAIIIACRKMNLEIFNYLFDNFEINNVQTRNQIISGLGFSNKYDVLDKFLIKYPGEILYNEFSHACHNYSEEIIACLISHGADINYPNPNDTTVLTKIAERNFIDVAQMLLDRKININHQSIRGWTALMAAVTNGHIEMVIFLMNNGADKTLKNDMRRDVLEMARYRNRVEIIDILTKN